ncbi:hypothetical protein DFH11DRAFT_116135 [Phellopilus nigrolimitatus]|nr:hypothetical protein DFH11DRAFT_116135 [Phellopilus nigrolimitatus]
MDKFSNIPFDVFSDILKLTDVESLFAVSQCNRRFREWAGTPLIWKEVIRRMQERGIQLPGDGFSSSGALSLSQLKRNALRACRIQRNWSSSVSNPTRAYLVDCSPARYMHGVFHPTQRLRWVIPISTDFFAVKLGYHMSSGMLQVWRRDGNEPRISVNYHHDWIAWGHCTDLKNEAWYFIYSEHNINQRGHTMHLVRFTGFNSDDRLETSVVAKFPTYGAPINIFFLDVTERKLCVVYSGSPTGTITLFFVPDWLKKESVHIDTGIVEDYRTNHSFVCTWDASNEHLILQYDVVPKKEARQQIYTFSCLMRFTLSEPAFPYPIPCPPLLEPSKLFEFDYVESLLDQGPFQELKTSISHQSDFAPILPHSSDHFQAPPLCSSLTFASSLGRGLNPTYVLQHHFVGLPGGRPFVRRLATPEIRRMAFAQDYMDTNGAARFPVGHALDLRGHELVALGHGCAAWVEAREPMDPNVVQSFDEVRFELKLVQFPWSREDGGRFGMPREGEDSIDPVVCTVACPPEVDLAKVTGLWLDAIQGRIFLGLKWGKFMVLHFD